jgi:hypothetical protein
MPDFRFEAIAVLIILLPGFFAARIEQRLTVNPDQNEFDKTVEALLYSFFVYLVFTAITHSFPISVKIEKVGEANRYSIEASILHLALLPLIALVLATLTSFASNNDLYGRVFRWLRVTRRTWRETVWSDVFHAQTGVVQVELADGRCIMGWLKYFSDRPGNAKSLFLERTAWVTPDLQGTIPIPGPGILLTEASDIRSVSFLDWHEEETAPQILHSS